MKNLYSNLTPIQKRFIVIGIISVLGVFTALFFIRGLSSVDYTPPVNEAEQLSRVQAAMEKALLEEYEGHAYHAAALEKFGEDSPFQSIVVNESVRIHRLENVFSSYKFDLPENSFSPEDMTVSDDLQDACKKAKRYEDRQVDVYESLVLDIVGQVEAEATMYQLKKLSEESTIPALEACINE